MNKLVFFLLFLSLWISAGCTGDDREPELDKACPVEAVEGSEDNVVLKVEIG